jgi:hypothetical protein
METVFGRVDASSAGESEKTSFRSARWSEFQPFFSQRDRVLLRDLLRCLPIILLLRLFCKGLDIAAVSLICTLASCLG